MLPTHKPIPESVLQRPEEFWARVDVNMYDTDACWSWKLKLTRTGYARTVRNLLAHRVAYSLVKGPIPEGLTIDHTCGNRGCVNPAHLEAVPITVNLSRRGRVATTPYPKSDSSARYRSCRIRGVCVECKAPADKVRCASCRAIHNAKNKGRPR